MVKKSTPAILGDHFGWDGKNWNIMKNKIFYCAAFFLILLFNSCRTQSDVIVFPQKGGNLVYTNPVQVKTSDIPFFSIDLTMHVSATGLDSDSSLKYTVAMDGMNRNAMENLNLELKLGDEIYPLSHTTIYVDSYGKSAIQIRMESKLSPEIVTMLIESDKNLLFVIRDSGRDFSTALPLDTFKKKVERLGIYL